MTTIYEYFGSKDGYRNVKEFVAGLECEIEAVQNGENNFGMFLCTKDGSLRNSGYEYVSAAPQTLEKLVQEFKSLHDYLDLDMNNDPFSVRTSTHVHVNCQGLEVEAVKNIVLLYALFEEFFFAMVKPVRRNNIHCVPLTETHLPSNYGKPLETMFSRWHKYTALNIKRLQDLGTLEFRHLHGTNDVEELTRWLSVLKNLWELGQKVVIDEAALQDVETIRGWFDTIFSPAPKILSLRPAMFSIISDSLIDVKFSTIKE